MATPQASDEADIRRRIDTLIAAIRAADLDGAMAIYAPDIESFDLDPPLRFKGADAKRKRWEHVFSMFQHPLSYQNRDLTITVGEDIAFAHSLNQMSGTFKNGHRSAFWLRWTGCFRKIDGNWLIVHEQASVPVDPASAKAVMDLEP
jgi:ketosteroid isomerase-like protein